MRHLIAPPQFSSETQTQRGWMVWITIWSTMLIVTTAMTLMFVALTDNWVRAAMIAGTVNMVGVVLLALNHRGHHRAAAADPGGHPEAVDGRAVGHGGVSPGRRDRGRSDFVVGSRRDSVIASPAHAPVAARRRLRYS